MCLSCQLARRRTRLRARSAWPESPPSPSLASFSDSFLFFFFFFLARFFFVLGRSLFFSAAASHIRPSGSRALHVFALAAGRADNNPGGRRRVRVLFLVFANGFLAQEPISTWMAGGSQSNPPTHPVSLSSRIVGRRGLLGGLWHDDEKSSVSQAQTTWLSEALLCVRRRRVAARRLSLLCLFCSPASISRASLQTAASCPLEGRRAPDWLALCARPPVKSGRRIPQQSKPVPRFPRLSLSPPLTPSPIATRPPTYTGATYAYRTPLSVRWQNGGPRLPVCSLFFFWGLSLEVAAYEWAEDQKKRREEREREGR